MVRQIVVTALIAAGNLWPSLAASQTVTPLWPAAPERSADASTRRDDATCPRSDVCDRFGTSPEIIQAVREQFTTRLVGHVHWSGGRKSTWGRPSGHRLCRPTPGE